MNDESLTPTLPPPVAPPTRLRHQWPDGPASSLSALVAVGVCAVAADSFLRSGVASVGFALFAIVVVGATLVVRPNRSRHAAAALVLGLAFAGWMALRASQWLVPLNFIACAGLIGIGTAHHDADDLSIRSLRRVFGAVGGVFAALLQGPIRILRALRTRSSQRLAGSAASILLGLVVALPVLAVFTMLLASADVVFASLLRPAISAEGVALHVVLLGFGTVVGTATVTASELPSPADPTSQQRRLLGPIETGIILGCVVVLFTAFVVTQFVTVLGGADHVLQTSGLTRAEYAREGFFQLLAVAGTTLALVVGLSQRRDVEAGSRAVFTLSVAVSMLTLTIVAVSLHRLVLYIDVFGLTMLRLYTVVFAGWIGVLFLVLIVHEAGVARLRNRLAFSAMITGLGLLFAMNVLNPEAFVVNYNVDHGVASFDADYGRSLSDDAIPALIDAAERLPDAAQDIRNVVCSNRPAPPHGWLSNHAVVRAEDALVGFCEG